MVGIERFYMLAVTSQAVGGATETFCIILKSHVPVSLEVTLEFNQNSSSLLREDFKIGVYHHCVPFQVPVVLKDSEASMNFEVKGWTAVQKKTTNIQISPPKKLIIIKTDKPIYKPGQIVKFRIVSLDSNFFIYSQTFPTIELQDPNSNRIGQWLNVPTQSGLVDLSYPINSEATNGMYMITVWDENNGQIIETFEVKDYVLPTFNVMVQFPSVITILDTEATLRVCAIYTYGKPVNGTVKAVVCQNGINYWWIRPYRTQAPNICRNYTMQTDRTGCAQQVINLKEFALSDSSYDSVLSVQSDVEEYGTGVIMKAFGSAGITTQIITLTFQDSPSVFKPGVKYVGKIKATDANSNPVVQKPLLLKVSIADTLNSRQELITDDGGIAQFSLDTESWSPELVSLSVDVIETEEGTGIIVNSDNLRTPVYPTGFLSLQPFYSKSGSFIEFVASSEPFSCDKIAQVEAQYVIRDNSCRPFRSDQGGLYIFYMVMSKGHLFQHGHLSVPFTSGQAEIKGRVSLLLQNVDKLSPVAQVVLYTLLSSGELVADSMNFPIQPCLKNKVSLNFTSPSELPGDPTSLVLKAAPGSLCSLRAIDKSLLQLQPNNDLNIESLFNMLPFRLLSGYPFSTYEEDSFTCQGQTPLLDQGFFGIFPYTGKVDAYNIFKDVGIKILTNADIRNQSACFGNFPMRQPQQFDLKSLIGKIGVGTIELSIKRVIRKYFPETWIWDLVSVSESGEATVSTTVPDSITTWQADAFCTSPIGFGVAPKTELTAFQPFFVSLTMPSSVIRGEMFTLKATVLNYLQSCIMVEVNLADSNQFSAEISMNSKTTFCLCADEGWTSSWTIKPLVLGEVTFTVTAEAVESSSLCGNSEVFVPEKGHIDTIIKTLLVQAEGTKETKTYNELLCPTGVQVEEDVSLSLPDAIVEGSATASISVLGDLMGRSLQNLASLLAMPYGCGEQNMLRFAPNIFILEYLESTNQLTPAIRSTAETYLVNGYQQELSYKHTDGSYSAFGMNDESGNTWLTAFVMKSFGKAKQYIFVDQMFVDQAKTWLGNQQQDNGCFASVGQLFHSDLKGGVNDEVTLSAYITAAMLELGNTVTDPVVNQSLACLRNSYAQVNSNYAKALLFYTFTLAGDQEMRNTLISDLDSVAINSEGGRHWSRENDGSVMDSLEVEMTSYVLLALMSGPLLSGFDLGYSSSIVYWLSQQQNAFGGFASTQDTVVALQALAKYSLATFSPAGTVTVTVTSSPSGQMTTFIINQSNRLLYQESQLQELPGDYNIRAEGEGCVYVQFTVHYNIPPPPDSSSFLISASASGNCQDPNSPLQLNITVIYMGDRPKTNMVLIEVQPLSGYRVDVNLMNQILHRHEESVRRVDQTDGKVIIYVDGLTKDKMTEYTLYMMQDEVVVDLKPAVVKVYDYYETGDVAVTDYSFPCVLP
ncbi:hypothetical protein HF521_006570 [Silurus meridionalis]|uniref:Alpha-2-macroglobulin-like protein 1 n=1 Tax=Silurus meridionalis TaxID=175797 RepID=A0A8T0ANV6_SILME|nr:hypothetical protein HF521_006570 [Silurus meridionalis]